LLPIEGDHGLFELADRAGIVNFRPLGPVAAGAGQFGAFIDDDDRRGPGRGYLPIRAYRWRHGRPLLHRVKQHPTRVDGNLAALQWALPEAKKRSCALCPEMM